MKNHLMGQSMPLFATEFSPGIGIHIKTRPVTTTDIDSNTVPLLKDVGSKVKVMERDLGSTHFQVTFHRITNLEYGFPDTDRD